MSWTNSFQPPPLPDASALWGPDPYDLNFAFPIHSSTLQNALVAIVPFIPRVHAEAIYNAFGSDADKAKLFKYLPWSFPNLETMLGLLEVAVRRDPGGCLFAVIDKTAPGPFAFAEDGQGSGALAGIIGIINGSPLQLTAELGALTILPGYQGTHVARNAVGLMLQYCLELPTAEKAGLGLRRVEWFAHQDNVPSRKTAEKMGFVEEGLTRWSWVLPPDKEGLDVRSGDPKEDGKGRHSVVYSLCWDDWEGGARERVQSVLESKK
ncbi:acyl-CoA N-acyltransferase [Punctularia strigosozonata HHB-11173 SS5]|uniref:Acyl-CoA N-acyltransferase n=1 Tax=Punctularia strigosozonata (strain HHB-11173) TaxID=741275 RepID=R7S3T6_PUNST|nr:acyl-CoA N-acyltransferase [Punctularia strigosozonata HHB-11173 SS5]EIN04868.1 acyl-CoA N-acyltransferase [Punctularia strigosozonata HHB-11173 SS5]